MALTLSSASIATGATVQAAQITQSIDALTGTVAYDITISGSLTVTGSLNMNGTLNATSSNAVSASYALTASFAATPTVSGISGISGRSGLSGIGLIWEGAWSSITNYQINDIVSSGGNSYIALNNNSDAAPSESPSSWALIAGSGLSGRSGISGLSGASGASGASGRSGLSGIGLSWISGGWDFELTYSINDLVSYNGSSYISLQNNNSNQIPSSSPSYWELVAASGISGRSGISGISGISGRSGISGLSALVSCSLAVSGSTTAQRAITATFSNPDSSPLTQPQQLIHWWTSTVETGSAQQASGTVTYLVVSGSNIVPIANSGSINHAVTDSNGKFAIRLTNTNTPGTATIWFNTEVQGIIYSISTTLSNANPA